MAGQLTYGYGSDRYESNLQLEHYDTGFQMDTAFFNRTGYSGGNFYFGRNFYPDKKRYPWFKTFTPFVFATGGRDRPQGGNEALGLLAVRFDFTRQGFLRLDTAAGQIPWRGRVFPLRFWRIRGNGQLFRWLNLDASAEFDRRAIYYDDVDPFSGRERSFSFGGTFQPNGRLNQQISYNRDTFDRLAGAGRVYSVDIVNSKTTYQFNRRFSVRAIGRFDSSRKRVLTDFLAAWEPRPGTVAYAGYGALFEQRGWDGSDWLSGQGNYINNRRGFFSKLSYLYRL